MPTPYLTKRALFPPQIANAPNTELGIVVVIPCYDEPDLIASLEALYQCEASRCAVEIIVVINEAENASKTIESQNQSTFLEAKSWISKHNTVHKQFHLIYQSGLPVKKAGVGLARKIGMDEAALRLETAGNPKGIITGFDADSLCEKNYFVAIEDHFNKYPDFQAASIWYEHPLGGDEFDDKVYQAIAQYELHLRYFTLAKRFAIYPHAYETIGSAMAVRADAYQQQGGMNTRKAGEDFYFLNKFMLLGKLNELNSTKVIPSPRISDRVPFGTGKAIGELLEKEQALTTYAFQSFEDLKSFVGLVPEMYSQPDFDWNRLPLSIATYLKSVDAIERVAEIRKNTIGFEAFQKRFFRWFDPFVLMKYVHFARDNFYPNIEVTAAGRWILENYFGKKVNDANEKTLLLEIRKLSKTLV